MKPKYLKYDNLKRYTQFLYLVLILFIIGPSCTELENMDKGKDPGPAPPAVQEELSDPQGYITAVIATAANDFSSGAHTLVDIDTFHTRPNILPTTSDITIVSQGHFFYRIERYKHDNVTKFDIRQPEKVIWQYSTLDPVEINSNPHDLVFVSSEKGYLIRYGAQKAWIVNPSASFESEFKIGELDLSDYADQDGLPEMHNAVIVDDKLFISLERLNRNSLTGVWEPNTAYVAVYDTDTDLEIDTGIEPETESDHKRRKGIPLTQNLNTIDEIIVENPISMQFLTEDHRIYVQGVGRYPFEGHPGKLTGGIVSIDPDTYEIRLVLDDGTENDHPYGNISGMAIVSPEKGYFVGYASWEHSTFYAFNPTTGEITGPVDALVDKNIAVLESGANIDINGRLWVCNRTDGGIVLLNPETDLVEQFIFTGLPPLKTVFCEW